MQLYSLMILREMLLTNNKYEQYYKSLTWKILICCRDYSLLPNFTYILERLPNSLLLNKTAYILFPTLKTSLPSRTLPYCPPPPPL